MLCKECDFFKIRYHPRMPYEMGMVECKKYNLTCEFTSKRKINRLVCVEEANPELTKECKHEV